VDQTLIATGKQAVAAPHFFLVRLKRDSLNKKDILPEFMVWLLNQPPAQRYFEQNAEGTLTKSIRRSVLEEAPVVVPPLAKQRAIVAMADTLREEQKLLQTLVNNGERMMGAIANDLYQAHAH
jgi:restriction endonuclease S subunit